MNKYFTAAIKPFFRAIKLGFSVFGYSLVKKELLVDYYLHSYASYEEYKDIQIRHNKRKISRVWADETTLNRVIDIVVKLNQSNVINGLCHGTRNGFEQNFLNNSGRGIHAFGTDISDTAAQLDNSVQWDFHNVNPVWIGKFDFVYSNSLDQSWNPRLAIATWLNQLNKDGVLLLEHTESHGPLGASEMDPFGVRPIAMPYILTDWFGNQISITHSKAKKSNKDIDAWLFVIKKINNYVV
jgi:hypothetical protein